MTRRAISLVAALACVACDIHLTMTDTPAAPTSPSPTSIAVTNTNTSTNTSDRADTSTTGPAPAPDGSSASTTPLPLPAYGEQVTREVSKANPNLILHSCQNTSGASAWQFLDRVIATLRERDVRWGYLCKDPGCTIVAADIVAYKATAADTGIWIVDVIGNHCPGPSDTPTVRWGVLPFETARRWTASR